MIVKQHALSKQTIILLAVLLVVLIGGGYFVYSNFFAKPSNSDQAVVSGEAQPLSLPPNITFDQTIFQNPQFISLQRQKFSGFTEQHAQMVLSKNVPLPPQRVTVVDLAIGGALTVSWQLPDSVNFNKVHVYRSGQAGQTGELIATLEVAANRKQMGYQDAKLTDNQVYYYLVKTVNEAGKESNNQQQVSGVSTDKVPPSQPQSVRVASSQLNGQDAIEVSWVQPIDSDFAEVRIYRSSEKGVIGSLLYEGVGIEQGGQNGEVNRIFDDSAIEPNIAYYYTVTSVDRSGNESSVAILATPYNTNPFEPIDF